MCQRNVPIKYEFVFLGKVDVSLTDSVQQLISLFRSLCITFGKPYSDKRVRIDITKKNIKEFCWKQINVCYFNFYAR